MEMITSTGTSSPRRGAFILLEGVDRCGKVSWWFCRLARQGVGVGAPLRTPFSSDAAKSTSNLTRYLTSEHPLLDEDDAGVPFSQASSVIISGRDRVPLPRSDNSRSVHVWDGATLVRMQL